MKIRKQSDEVLYAEGAVVEVSRTDVGFLVEESRRLERSRIRLCAHSDAGDSLHEMLIVHSRTTYVPPHKHLNKSESFHVIEGTADVVLFEDDGKIRQVVRMGAYGTDRIFYYRLKEPLYHTLLIHSEWFVFHESTNGPFRPEDTRMAPWAPQADDEAAQAGFISSLKSRVEEFNSRKP